jgi:hypothetical protein
MRRNTRIIAASFMAAWIMIGSASAALAVGDPDERIVVTQPIMGDPNQFNGYVIGVLVQMGNPNLVPSPIYQIEGTSLLFGFDKLTKQPYVIKTVVNFR